MTKRTQIITLIGLLVILAGLSIYALNSRTSEPVPAPVSTSAPVSNEPVIVEKEGDIPPKTLSIKYYVHKEDPLDCGVTREVTKEIPYTVAVADASLRTLFEEDMPELADDYLGVIVSGGVARINFKEEALSSLNGPACLQFATKAPIEKTLLQFDSVEKIEYEINGETFDEWDA